MKKLLIYILFIISGLSCIYSMESDNQPMQTDEVVGFDQLPDELKVHIFMMALADHDDFDKLVKSLVSISQVNQDWRRITQSKSFFKPIFITFFKKMISGVNRSEWRKNEKKIKNLLDIIEPLEKYKSDVDGSGACSAEEEPKNKRRKINYNSETFIKQIIMLLKPISYEFNLNNQIINAIIYKKLPEIQKLIVDGQKMKDGELWYYDILFCLIKSLKELSPEVDSCQWEKLIRDLAIYLNNQIGNKYDIEAILGLALMVAADQGCLAIVEHLIELNSNLLIGRHFEPALVCGVKNGHFEVVKTLLRYFSKSNVQNKNIFCKELMLCAIKKGHLEILKYLLDYIVNDKNKNNVLAYLVFFAIQNVDASSSKLEIVKTLIDYGAKVNIRSKNKGATFLMVAAENNDLDTVKFLISQGADVNIQDNNGKTSLMTAVSKGNLEIVKYIIINGANVDIQDINGDTALVYAARAENLDIIALLLDHNADMHIKNRAQQTALEIAAIELKRVKEEFRKKVSFKKFNTAQNCLEKKDLVSAAGNGYLEIVELLISQGIEINKKNSCGQTALMTAALGGHLDIMRLLIAHNIDLTIKDSSEKTALEIVVSEIKSVKEILSRATQSFIQLRRFL